MTHLFKPFASVVFVVSSLLVSCGPSSMRDGYADGYMDAYFEESGFSSSKLLGWIYLKEDSLLWTQVRAEAKQWKEKDEAGWKNKFNHFLEEKGDSIRKVREVQRRSQRDIRREEEQARWEQEEKHREDSIAALKASVPDFFPFWEKFTSDSAFQINHVQFPFTVSVDTYRDWFLEGDYEDEESWKKREAFWGKVWDRSNPYVPVKRIQHVQIKKQDWRRVDFHLLEGHTLYWETIEHNLVELRFLAEPVSSTDLKFEKIKGTWKLTQFMYNYSHEE